MASPKLIALFLTFAMAAAAVLQPSEAARMVQAQQAFKPAAAAGQEAAEKAALADQAAGGVPVPRTSTTTTPPAGGIPAGLPPQLLPAILGLLFPGLGGIIGLLQPLIPLLPPPGSSSPPLQGAGKLGASLTSTSSTPQPPQPTECMTPLAGMLPCTDYLTNITVLTPPASAATGSGPSSGTRPSASATA